MDLDYEVFRALLSHKFVHYRDEHISFQLLYPKALFENFPEFLEVEEMLEFQFDESNL